MDDAEAKLKSTQDRVALLSKQVEGATGEAKDAANAQMMLAKAELELDQDELNDAKEDLIRAGGNPEGTLQRLLDEHEAADHAGENTTTAATASTPNTDNFLGLAQTWITLRRLRGQLAEAENQSQAAIDTLSQEHDALEARVNAEASRRQATKSVAAGLANEAASQRDERRRWSRPPHSRRSNISPTIRKVSLLSTNESRTKKNWPICTPTGTCWRKPVRVRR